MPPCPIVTEMKQWLPELLLFRASFELEFVQLPVTQLNSFSYYRYVRHEKFPS